MPRLTAVCEWLSATATWAPATWSRTPPAAAPASCASTRVGFIAGLAAVGYVQEGSLLMGPFFVIFMGISLVTVPEAARMLRRSPRHLQRYCGLVGAGLSRTGPVLGPGSAGRAAPRARRSAAARRAWQPAYALVLPLTISMMGACVTAGATAGLRALGVARRSLRAKIIASGIFLVLGVLGAVAAGAAGSVEGTALATWIGAGVSWWLLRIGAARTRPRRPALSPHSPAPPTTGVRRRGGTGNQYQRQRISE